MAHVFRCYSFLVLHLDVFIDFYKPQIQSLESFLMVMKYKHSIIFFKSWFRIFSCLNLSFFSRHVSFYEEPQTNLTELLYIFTPYLTFKKNHKLTFFHIFTFTCHDYIPINVLKSNRINSIYLDLIGTPQGTGFDYQNPSNIFLTNLNLQIWWLLRVFKFDEFYRVFCTNTRGISFLKFVPLLIFFNFHFCM